MRGITAINRRGFLSAAMGAGVSLALPPGSFGEGNAARPLRFGLIADPHQDIMHDAASRVGAFVRAMEAEKADFIVQLGDFCQPHPRNQAFLETFRAFEGPAHHVLGNHDMDGGYAREETVAYYGMPHRHYTFEAGGVRFIVLDCNDRNPEGTGQGYSKYVAKDQAEWLEGELADAKAPCVILSHQPLDNGFGGGIDNGDEIRAILENANADGPKVIACFSGHLHRNYAKLIGGIYYIQINSASYHWLGGDYKHRSYPDEIHEAHPWIEYTAPYRDPLWAVAAIDPAAGVLEIRGRRSEWVGPNPVELGAFSVDDSATVEPAVSDWRMPAMG